MDMGKDIASYVAGMNQALPGILTNEAQYRPQFQGLNLGDINAFLNGTNGQNGLLALSGQAQSVAQQQMRDAQARDYGSMTGNAGLLRGVFDTLSPEGAARVQQSNAMANRAYQASQGLTPQEARASDQMAREAFAARGRVNDNASVAAEALNRDDVLARKRQEAASLGQSAMNMSNGFYSAPGLQMLNSMPLSTSLGQQYLQFGLGSIGAGTPQLYDIGTALNIGAAQRQNQVNAAAANAQASASRSAGMWGGIGALAGNLFKLLKPHDHAIR